MAKSKKPTVNYKSQKLFVFDSIEEQEAANYLYISNQDATKRIKENVDLILRVYGFTRQTIKKRKLSNRIIFDS